MIQLKNAPKTVSFNGENLIRMKAEGKAPKEVLSFLKKRADELLTSEPLTVTKRNCKAEGGTPNDYASIGIYWWPNPDTDTGLPYIRRDGERNPITNEKHSIDKFANAVLCLTLAAFYFNDEKYAKRAEELLEIWFINTDTRMNPNGEFAQGIPGRCTGRGIGLIEYIHFIDIMNSLAILEAMDMISNINSELIRAWFRDLTDWMLTSEKGMEESCKHNNHGAWFDVQILALSRFSNRKYLTEKICNTALDIRHKRHIKNDGSLPFELERTRAIHYTLFNIIALEKIAVMAKLSGDGRYIENEEDGDPLIKRAMDYIYPFAAEGKPFPYQEIHMSSVGAPLAEALMFADALFPMLGYKEKAESHLKENMLFRLVPQI